MSQGSNYISVQIASLVDFRADRAALPPYQPLLASGCRQLVLIFIFI